MDTICGTGQNKCLLILGLSYQEWRQKCYQSFDRSFSVFNLQHQDVTVLQLSILVSTKGEIIADILHNLAHQVGQPIQIISDRGTDIKKGIDLFLQTNPSTIYVYDFTHQIALWLKHKFSSDPVFQDFLEHTTITQKQIQQTELAFLRPPKLRTKARYHNIDLLVEWGLNILHYWEKQDFSLINQLFIIDAIALINLQGQIPISFIFKLIQHLNFKTSDRTTFSQYLVEQLEITENIDPILAAANLGRRRFLDKFDWILKFKTKLQDIAQMLDVFAFAKHHFTLWGLRSTSLQEWLDLQLDYTEPSQIEAFNLVSDYLSTYTTNIPPALSLLPTSDIIESLFGKYKSLLENQPFFQINAMVLSLVLSTTKITTDLINRALESITNNDVIDWIKSTFGQSLFSQRKQAFSNL